MAEKKPDAQGVIWDDAPVAGSPAGSVTWDAPAPPHPGMAAYKSVSDPVTKWISSLINPVVHGMTEPYVTATRMIQERSLAPLQQERSPVAAAAPLSKAIAEVAVPQTPAQAGMMALGPGARILAPMAKVSPVLASIFGGTLGGGAGAALSGEDVATQAAIGGGGATVGEGAGVVLPWLRNAGAGAKGTVAADDAARLATVISNLVPSLRAKVGSTVDDLRRLAAGPGKQALKEGKEAAVTKIEQLLPIGDVEMELGGAQRLLQIPSLLRGTTTTPGPGLPTPVPRTVTTTPGPGLPTPVPRGVTVTGPTPGQPGPTRGVPVGDWEAAAELAGGPRAVGPTPWARARAMTQQDPNAGYTPTPTRGPTTHQDPNAGFTPTPTRGPTTSGQQGGEGMFTLREANDALSEIGARAFSKNPLDRTFNGVDQRQLYGRVAKDIEAGLLKADPTGAALKTFQDAQAEYKAGIALLKLLENPNVYRKGAQEMQLNTPALQRAIANPKIEAALRDKLGDDGFQQLADALLRGGPVGRVDVLAPGMGNTLDALRQVYARGQGGSPQILGSLIRTLFPNMSEYAGRTPHAFPSPLQAVVDAAAQRGASEVERRQRPAGPTR